MTQTNPLLDSGLLPRFGDIRPDHILPAVETAIADHRAAMRRCASAQGYDAIFLAKDRADARAREIVVKDKLPAVLAIAVTCGFFAVLFLAFTRGVNDQSRDLANIMIGTLGTAWVSVITYYFGSSAGSAQKSELLATMEKRKS